MNKLLTTKDVAELLQVQPNKIYQLRREDPTFPFHNILGSLRYVEEEILLWVASKSKGEKYLEEKHLQQD